MSRKKIWIHPPDGRCFVIPDDARIHPGDFELESSHQQFQVRVREEDLVTYACSEDEAMQVFLADFRNTMGGYIRELEHLTRRFKRTGEGADEQPPVDPEALLSQSICLLYTSPSPRD